jgi:hypothetical protein
MMRCVTIAALALTWAASVEAHQLDEYLQASRLDVSRDRIVVELTLTPGTLIAPRLLTSIGGDRLHTISSEDLTRYAQQVLDDLRLSIDGRTCHLTATRVVASLWDELADGTGSIRLEAVTDAARITGGSHRIAYENSHAPVPSVYLVNALKPGRDVRIAAQRRDRLQHQIELDVEVDTLRGGAIEAAAGAGLIALLIAIRWRAGRRRLEAEGMRCDRLAAAKAPDGG